MGRPLTHQERERKLDLRNWNPPHPMQHHNQLTAVYQILKQTVPSSVRFKTPQFSVCFMIESPWLRVEKCNGVMKNTFMETITEKQNLQRSNKLCRKVMVQIWKCVVDFECLLDGWFSLVSLLLFVISIV